MKRGRFDESIELYQKALSIDPNFVASYIGIGNDYQFMGRPEDARAAFTQDRYGRPQYRRASSRALLDGGLLRSGWRDRQGDWRDQGRSTRSPKRSTTARRCPAT